MSKRRTPVLADGAENSTLSSSPTPPAEKSPSTPARFASLADKDYRLSKFLAICGSHSQRLPFHLSVLRYVCKLLEYSGHGVPWFILAIAKVSVAIRPDHIEFWSNMILALSLELWTVAIIKAIIRRPRPVYSPQVGTLPYNPDKYSFPSGHSSRAVMEAVLWCSAGFTGLTSKFLMVLWGASVCLSRIILGRHYFSDVCAGTVLGIFLGWVQLNIVWMDLPLCRWLLSPIHNTISM
ncbi:hypothetical protein RvY_02605 [Ramazzottius varieornatus]|uniref:Phosphatidic acid phosphatase type 2/haloperoxidase domain-containing protein n=1 Tax=Ramazzottius varieornatus TaxID=947166 RepID=A0A1D1UL23_RAMVA|nr:hypothetical protein RvY_02605 [Ramazzottius varieornatus]